MRQKMEKKQEEKKSAAEAQRRDATIYLTARMTFTRPLQKCQQHLRQWLVTVMVANVTGIRWIYQLILPLKLLENCHAIFLFFPLLFMLILP